MGLPLETPQANQQWILSQILNISPFSDEILNLNQAQIAWIIEKYNKQNPGKLKITTLEQSKELLATRGWTDVLEGMAREEWMKQRTPAFKHENLKG